MKKRFSEEQIIGFLQQAEAGVAIKELCRQHGFSDASFYNWRAKFGGMSVPDAKRLKELEAENAKLKRLLAESILDAEAQHKTINGLVYPGVDTQRDGLIHIHRIDSDTVII